MIATPPDESWRTAGPLGADAAAYPLTAGVLLLDKPTSWTSFDVVKKLRGIVGNRKIGHAGTLDPLATGLLICCVGRATKLVSSYTDMYKVYEGTLRLGQTTASYDAETDVLESRSADHLRIEDVVEATKPFIGEITQIPPMYSAIKVNGERLYRAARKGKEVVRPPRHLTIDSFDILAKDGPDVAFRVKCSKGTYIRSLAHDLGAGLDVGAHLIQLRRTHIGEYSVDDAWTLEGLSQHMEGTKVEPDDS